MGDGVREVRVENLAGHPLEGTEGISAFHPSEMGAFAEFELSRETT